MTDLHPLPPLKPSQKARDAAADILDEVSSLLGDDGIGQVADLIRDGEYDEHQATKIVARFERDLTAPSSAGDVESLLIDFYVSPAYDPKAKRPADVVKAAIAFALASTATKLAEVERERDEARRALERDRTAVCIAVNEITTRMDSYAHLREFGRGPYAWDDDRYQQEFGQALDYFESGIQPLRRISADWSNCPTDPAEITAARATLKENDRG